MLPYKLFFLKYANLPKKHHVHEPRLSPFVSMQQVQTQFQVIDLDH
jgi:hypothetical protein